MYRFDIVADQPYRLSIITDSRVASHERDEEASFKGEVPTSVKQSIAVLVRRSGERGLIVERDKGSITLTDKPSGLVLATLSSEGVFKAINRNGVLELNSDTSFYLPQSIELFNETGSFMTDALEQSLTSYSKLPSMA